MHAAQAALRSGGVLAFLFFLLLGSWLPARAEPAPLTAAEQEKINKAIEKGVGALRSAQGKLGTWDQKVGPHCIGYAALPGLVLLECGAKPNDPAVQAAAKFIRANLAVLEDTYDLSLAILFLDLLGDPQDKNIIQYLAARLIVGQTASGGWGYKIPQITPVIAKQVLKALQQIEKLSETGPDQTTPSDKKAPTKPSGSGPKSTPRKPRLILPLELQGLPVFMDPRLLRWTDPPGRDRQPLDATTDNSNTQFALLALWVAQRHDVPLKRSLNLVALRFRRSQHRDGTWFYNFQPAEEDKPTKTMTCVGLLGLALGHGLAHDGRGMDRPEEEALIDPQIRKGFAALSRYVGNPVGRMEKVPLENLYFLWSVERVAVLYNLATIGDHDWYRWGAEILIANQHRDGAWMEGGYHGAEPVANTCLALLFLKRVNLIKDLTGKLRVDARLLNEAIRRDEKRPAEAVPPVPPTKTPQDTSRPVPKTTINTDPKTVTPSTGDKQPPVVTKPAQTQPVANTAAPEEQNDDDTSDSDDGLRRRWPTILLGCLLILGAPALFLLRKRRTEEEDE